MERYDVDADAAFAILRRTSQRSNTKLAKVAAELVDRHSATASNQSRGGAGLGVDGGAVPNIAALVELDLDLTTNPEAFFSAAAHRHSGTAAGDGEGSNPVGAHDNMPESPCRAEQYAVTGEVLVVACRDLDLPNSGHDGGGRWLPRSRNGGTPKSGPFRQRCWSPGVDDEPAGGQVGARVVNRDGG